MKHQNDNQNEFIRWVNLSTKFSIYENFFAPVIQGLGRLSMQLDGIDSEILKKMHTQENETIEFSLKLTHAFTQSYLWVLGAYEAIRTLHQLVRLAEQKENTKKELAEEIKKVKHLFEEIRIPLAKMEVPKRHRKNPDFSPIAYPVLDAKRGIAWNIGKEKFISRKELSEALLGMMDLNF